MRRVVSALILAAVSAAPFVMAPVAAKLPPLSDEAKAKAAETAAKSAWTDKVGAFQLCRAMDRTAETYRNRTKAAGKEAPVAVETPPCADPGPFVPPVAVAASAAPPLEASGAHSPTTMATAPPSSKATAAEVQGTAKK